MLERRGHRHPSLHFEKAPCSSTRGSESILHYHRATLPDDQSRTSEIADAADRPLQIQPWCHSLRTSMAFQASPSRMLSRAASGAVLLVVALAMLAVVGQHGATSRVELNSYSPPMLQPPRQGGSDPSPAGAEESHEYAGRPTDWRRKQETGRHPTEANVGVDENTYALEGLLKAAGGGATI